MESFINWIGGKRLLRKEITDRFPDDVGRYIEVFGGAGWVLFSKERHAEMEVFNDINGELINLFRCVKYHSEAVQKELEFSLLSREQFFDAKAQLDVRGLTDIQRAARYFLLIKESFGADKRSFATKNINLHNAIQYLSQVQKRLKSVVVENKDFEDIIKVYDRPNALFYLDPPYLGAEKYYHVDFNAEDHMRLKNAVSNMKGKFLLSYNAHPEVLKLYQEFNIEEVGRPNLLAANDNSTPYKEFLIRNY